MRTLRALIVVLALAQPVHVVAASAVDDERIPRNGGFYVGPQLGVPGILGVRGRYLGAIDNVPMFYIDADISLGFWTGGALGAGMYLTDNLYTGIKVHGGSQFEEQFTCYNRMIGAEIGYTWALTQSRTWLFTIDGGPALMINSCPNELYERYRMVGIVTLGFRYRLL